MKIAAVILTRTNLPLTRDTLESVQTYMTDRVLVIVDEAGWPLFEKSDLPVTKGLYHNCDRSPYRNYALGLSKLYKQYPDCDWYVWLENDALVTSSHFLRDLELATAQKVWMLGCDLRTYPFEFPLLQEILGCGEIQSSHYLLGALHFHHHDFLQKLHELNFFSRFLEATKESKYGEFPCYGRYAFEEELWATLAHHLGGRLKELSCWLEDSEPRLSIRERWRGSLTYAVRFRPEFGPHDVPSSATIIHPSKNYNSPIRQHYRKIRHH